MLSSKSIAFVCLSGLLIIVSLAINASMLQAQLPLPPGVPRGDVFIISMDDPGRILMPDDMNLWKPGHPVGTIIVHEPLWFLNVTNGKLVPMLAAAPPEYSNNFTIMRIKLRPGIYWNDGVEFTADDVVYTIKLHKNVTGFSWSSYIQTWVEDVTKEDKYTVVIKLKAPNPKFHFTFVTALGMTGLQIMPKHVFEKVKDPLAFKFNPPVGTSPYVLKDYDPNGYWFLFERREDWERTATGKVLGKPKPKYVLRIYYGTDEKEVIAISRHELDITQIGYELWETAKSSNPFLMAFWKGFPFAWQNGICDHGPVFNLAKYPYNITDVRWALTLAINITEVDIYSLEAVGRIATFRSLSIPYIQKFYESKLLPWIKNFTLPDGYKPFDETVPYKIANYVEKVMGYELAADPVTIYGPGWWKYDPEEATKLLEKHGFYKDKNGKWHLPDGSLWKLDLVIPIWHGLASRIGYGVAEQWRKFGIDVVEDAVEAGLYSPRMNVGDFDVIIAWPFCCAHYDVWQWWQGFHKRYYKPLGEPATSNQMRWVNDKVSELLDKLGTMSPDDPEVIDIVAEIIKESFKDMPCINMFLGSKLIVFDTYVWRNFPTGDNWYWEHGYWNPQWMLPILVKIEPTGNVPSSEYGTPSGGGTSGTPNITTLNATIAEISVKISNMSAQLNDLSMRMTRLVDLEEQTRTLEFAIIAEGLVIIVMLILVAIILRRR